MAKMREELRPGITENQLWSHLHQVNIALGGEWIETRLLNSGGRTNPWFQESSDRVIRAGELVSFDTDLIGPFGYCSDLSRTFYCGHGRPTGEQQGQGGGQQQGGERSHEVPRRVSWQSVVGCPRSAVRARGFGEGAALSLADAAGGDGGLEQISDRGGGALQIVRQVRQVPRSAHNGGTASADAT